MLESLFLYLDRVVIPKSQNEGFLSIRTFGINFFRSFTLSHLHKVLSGGELLAQNLLSKLVILFNRLRQDKIRTGPLFELAGRIISMLRDVQIYSDEALNFERVFLQATISFYERESSAVAAKSSLTAYLKYASDRLAFEADCICTLLAPSSKDKLLFSIQETVISNRMDFLFPAPFGTSLRELFDKEDLGSLRLLYDLINRVCAIERLNREWSAFIRTYGHFLLATVHEFVVIGKIAKFKEQIDIIIRDCFFGDPHLQGALQDSFESFVNARGDRMVELLVLYIHNHMQKKMSKERAASFITMSLTLFRYLYRKESFDAYYKRSLAQRLLFSTDCDLELENQFIAELGKNCGENFVLRMESMLKDWRASEDFSKAFKTGYQNRLLSVTSISVVSILWPQTLQADTSMKIPSGLREIESAFGSFYLEQKKGAKLTWNRRMGSCVMNAYFSGSVQPKELSLTTPQALILLQFNAHDTVRMSRLASALEMSPALLEETVASLSTSKYPILLRSEDQVSYNANFSTDVRKVPFYLLQSPFLSADDVLAGESENGMSTSATSTPDLSAVPLMTRPVSMIAERQLQVDCLLVRRMKSVTKCPRTDLVNFVLATLKDLPISAVDVNGRIDGLLDKEFLKLNDAFTISYVP